MFRVTALERAVFCQFSEMSFCTRGPINYDAPLLTRRRTRHQLFSTKTNTQQSIYFTTSATKGRKCLRRETLTNTRVAVESVASQWRRGIDSVSNAMRREIHHQVRQQQQKVMRSESIPLEVNLSAPRISEAQAVSYTHLTLPTTSRV